MEVRVGDGVAVAVGKLVGSSFPDGESVGLGVWVSLATGVGLTEGESTGWTVEVTVACGATSVGLAV